MHFEHADAVFMDIGVETINVPARKVCRKKLIQTGKLSFHISSCETDIKKMTQEVLDKPSYDSLEHERNFNEWSSKTGKEKDKNPTISIALMLLTKNLADSVP